MSLTLVSNPRLAKIDTLELDASMRETHAIDIEVTDHPVEQGVNISDHRRRKPRTFVIEGIVSNTPIPSPSSVPAQVSSKGFNWLSASQADSTRVETAYSQLKALCDSTTLITVVTALDTYENMTITALNVPRDSSIGQSLHFTATLREIRIVRNDTATISAKTTRAQPTVNKHKKGKTETVPDKRDLSLRIQEDGITKATSDYVKELTGLGK